jgi:hypothetical protein
MWADAERSKLIVSAVEQHRIRDWITGNVEGGEEGAAEAQQGAERSQFIVSRVE